jgi:hypothetical protein
VLLLRRASPPAPPLAAPAARAKPIAVRTACFTHRLPTPRQLRLKGIASAGNVVSIVGMGGGSEKLSASSKESIAVSHTAYCILHAPPSS